MAVLVEQVGCETDLGHVLDDDAETVDVDNIREHALLLGHLLVNTVEMLLPADDLGLNALFGKPAVNSLLDLG